jgi:CBS domain-containing protein
MGYRDEIGTAVKWDGGSIEAGESLRDAIGRIIEANVSALVVKLDGVVAGVVTDMDVLKYVAEKRDLDKTRVSEIMTACELITRERNKIPCVQLHETETVENAMRVMDGAGVHNLLVSADGDAKAGMLSIRDLLRLL